MVGGCCGVGVALVAVAAAVLFVVELFVVLFAVFAAIGAICGATVFVAAVLVGVICNVSAVANVALLMLSRTRMTVFLSVDCVMSWAFLV